MSWSLSIGTIAGTVVRIHLTFLLFLAWIFAAGYSRGGADAAWDSVLFMVLLFGCVLLHEFGHIFTAIKTLGPDARVTEAMTPDIPTIGHRSSLDEAFKLLQDKQAVAVGVTDAAGRLTGLITSETIAEMVMLGDALPKDTRGPWGRPAGA